MSKATQGFFIFVGIILVIGMCAGSAAMKLFSNRVTYGEEIGMLQPSGWNLNRDYKASEVNVNNSAANENNGQAHAYNAQALGDLSATIRFAEQALMLTPENDQFRRAQAEVIRGAAHRANGELEVAYKALESWNGMRVGARGWLGKRYG